jgi:peptide/nickel transport system substrate-binding protein
MKKITWLTLGLLVILSMVMGSWARAAETPKPKYGGTLTTMRAADTRGFDQAWVASPTAGAYNIQLTNDMLTMPDWTKTNLGIPNSPYQWLIGDFAPLEIRKGMLIESWEFPNSETIIYHVRKGVHFHNKPPTNGREMTAEDVAFSLERVYSSPKCYWGRAYKSSSPVSVKATDRYTVVMKTKVKTMKGATALLMEITMGQIAVVPKDAVDHYGDLNDWKNSIGTGPYMLTKYLPNSSFEFVRNPNYWQMDPYHPENRLPYPDKFVYLIIQDKSTRLAALRTGKVDISAMTEITWEDYDDIKKTAPKLMERKMMYNFPRKIYMRVDTKPFDDIRVRRALNMAIDRESIVNDYWGGNAELLSSPLLPGIHPFYTPLNELPKTTQDMYKYNPEKAKKLLAQAGYPNGFKMNVLVPSFTSWVSEVEILKAYFAKIGVDLNIEVKEYGVYVSVITGKKHKDSAYTQEGTGAAVYKILYWNCGTVLNFLMSCDQPVQDAYEKVFTWDTYKNTKERNKIYKDIYKFIIDKAYEVHFPTPYVWTMWWPWVKNYHGEKMTYGANYTFWAYPWVDQDLKESMTGRR